MAATENDAHRNRANTSLGAGTILALKRVSICLAVGLALPLLGACSSDSLGDDGPEAGGGGSTSTGVGAGGGGGVGGVGGGAVGGGGAAAQGGQGGTPELAGCPATLPAGLVYCEDFEDGDELDTYGSSYQEHHDTFLGSTELIDSDGHASSHCLRGNLGSDGTPDAITGEPGAINPHANIGLGDVAHGSTANFELTSIDTGEIAISWWVRFDVGELANLGSGKQHKMLYSDNTSAENYIIPYVTSSGDLRMVVNGDNDSGYPYTAGDDSSNQYQYGYHLNRDGQILDDGAWHHLMVWMRYGTAQQHDGEIRFWLDEELVLDVDDAWLIYFEGEQMGNFALPSNWNALGALVSSVGWQVDDIQIWDRDPTAS